MRECQELQPTVLRDIISMCEADVSIKDIVNLIGSEDSNARKLYDVFKDSDKKSLFKRTSDLVLVFPVLVSSSIKVDTAILISKAIERKCVSLLQVLFSSVDITSLKDTPTIQDYVSKYHRNIKLSGSEISLDDFVKVMGDIGASHESAIIDKESYDAVMESLRGINNVAKDIMRESSVNDFVVNKTMFGRTNVTLEANNNAGGNASRNLAAGYVVSPKDLNTAVRAIAGDEATNALKNRMSAMQKASMDAGKTEDFIKSQIVPGEVKKANELQPTLMVVRFNSIVDGNPIVRSGVVGVKAKMYPIDNMELINRISNKYSDSNTLFNFVQASTKEKSFFKDFVFAIDKLKGAAVKSAKGSMNSRLFTILERRANSSNLRKLLLKQDASPITTLVISQDEVEYLRKYNNMDMEKASVAKVVMNGYNLMGVVVVDDSIEVAKFLFDDDEMMYESITYKALAKEGNDTDYKKIIDLMTRIK